MAVRQMANLISQGKTEDSGGYLMQHCSNVTIAGIHTFINFT